MSILIPDMKMPTRCWDCPCAYETEGVSHNYCQAVGYDTELPDEGRPEWCPLIELPPHGRLIDADAFLAQNAYFADREFVNPKYDDTLKDLIDRADTIIPADGGADNA